MNRSWGLLCFQLQRQITELNCFQLAPAKSGASKQRTLRNSRIIIEGPVESGLPVSLFFKGRGGARERQREAVATSSWSIKPPVGENFYACRGIFNPLFCYIVPVGQNLAPPLFKGEKYGFFLPDFSL